MYRRNQEPFASPLLIHSSRPVCDDLQSEKLKLSVRSVNTGYPIAQEAEQHGLSPLVFHHLTKNNAAIADPEMKKLRVQFFRKRDRNRILMKELENILAVFHKNNIDVLVLKGGALCNLIYPDKTLRPMRDLDLLVKEEDFIKAFEQLSDMGFSGGKAKETNHFLHAMPAMKKEEDDVVIEVDLHKNVFTNLHPASLNLEHAKKPLIFFKVGDQTAFTLGYEEMLLHLCHHLITPGQLIKLISVADIMGFTTHYADKIDWDVLCKKYPFVINTIRMLDLLVPLSVEVRRTVGLEKAKIGRDVGVDYKGWPNTSFPATRTGENSFTELFFDSISAPEWWLRLHYGYKDIFPIWFCRYIRHPLRLFKIAFQWFFLLIYKTFRCTEASKLLVAIVNAKRPSCIPTQSGGRDAK